MNLSLLKKKLTQTPIIKSSLFKHLSAKPNSLRVQISRWVTQKKLVKLRRGMYTLPKEERSCSTFYIANTLYYPSYISLESALSYYGLIPESTPRTLSITTKKTHAFSNSYGHFDYHHIKPSLFDHFEEITDEFGLPVKIACPEKALLDFFYFRTQHIGNIDISIFDASFRLQHLGTLKKTRLKKISTHYKTKKMTLIMRLFWQYLKDST